MTFSYLVNILLMKTTARMQLEPQLVKKRIKVTHSSQQLRVPTLIPKNIGSNNTSEFRFHVLDLNIFSLDSCWSRLDQRWLRGSVTVSFFSLTRVPFFKRLNLPLSVSKPTVICPEFLLEVRWLPRLSQPVQCKDRKSQGSTPHTPDQQPSQL